MKGDIIGNPNVFAIEYIIEFVKAETIYGTCQVWIEGKYFGDVYESEYLGRVCSEIQNFPKSYYRRYKDYEELKWAKEDTYYKEMKDLYDDIPNISSSPKEFIAMFEGTDLASGFSNETFDRFYVTYYWRGDKVIFYWCLDPDVAEDIETYPQFKNYPKEVQKAEVSIEIMKQVTDEFEEKIEKLINENKVKK